MDMTLSEQIAWNDLLAHSVDGVFVIDRQRRFVFFNAGCERITGYKASQVVNANCRCGDVNDCHDEAGRSLMGSLCPGMAVFDGDVTSLKQRMQITTQDGESRWVETLYTAVRSEEGYPEFVIAVMRALSDKKRNEGDGQQTIADLRQEIERLRKQMRHRFGFASIVTRSFRMQGVLDRIHEACCNVSPVVICGENGSGRSAVARMIAYNGQQKNGPLVTMNVSAIPRHHIDAELFGYVRGAFAVAAGEYEGLYRAADGGTLFIKDIERLPDSTQARLLQALQDRAISPMGSTERVPVNVRLLVCTSSPVKELVARDVLREDLSYRIGVLTIDVPPLCARKEDIPLLVCHFVDELNQQSVRQVEQVSSDVWSVLGRYDWPGNVRELQSVIDSAFATGTGSVLEAETIRLPVVSRPVGRGSDNPSNTLLLEPALAAREKQLILDALRLVGGHRSRAAKLMGISRSRLYRRMDALGIGHKKEDTF